MDITVLKYLHVYSLSQDGCTPLHKAAWDGHNDIVKALLDKDNSIINCKENVRGPVLFISLLFSSLKGGWAAINNAVMRGHHEVVKTLIEEGADTGAKDEVRAPYISSIVHVTLCHYYLCCRVNGHSFTLQLDVAVLKLLKY